MIIAPPGVRGWRIDDRSPLARQRFPAGGIGHLQQRQGQGRPARSAEARFEIDAAGDAVRVQFHIDVSQSGGRFRQRRHGQRFDQLAVQANLLVEQRQRHAAVSGERGGQIPVSRGIGGVGFREHDIQRDRFRPGRGELADQIGVNVARPWPAAQFPQALFVDGDDDDVLGRRPRLMRQAPVVEQQIPTVESARMAQHEREHGQRQRQANFFGPAEVGSKKSGHRARISPRITTTPIGQ